MARVDARFWRHDGCVHDNLLFRFIFNRFQTLMVRDDHIERRRGGCARFLRPVNRHRDANPQNRSRSRRLLICQRARRRRAFVINAHGVGGRDAAVGDIILDRDIDLLRRRARNDHVGSLCRAADPHAAIGDRYISRRRNNVISALLRLDEAEAYVVVFIDGNRQIEANGSRNGLLGGLPMAAQEQQGNNKGDIGYRSHVSHTKVWRSRFAPGDFQNPG